LSVICIWNRQFYQSSEFWTNFWRTLFISANIWAKIEVLFKNYDFYQDLTNRFRSTMYWEFQLNLNILFDKILMLHFYFTQKFWAIFSRTKFYQTKCSSLTEIINTLVRTLCEKFKKIVKKMFMEKIYYLWKTRPVSDRFLPSSNLWYYTLGWPRTFDSEIQKQKLWKLCPKSHCFFFICNGQDLHH